MNTLEQLKAHSIVVADTGDFNRMRQFTPRDATTNPTLILKAVQDPQYADLFTSALRKTSGSPLEEQVDQVLVDFGCEILKIVPGRVSTEVDARLSFDTAATIARAQRIIARYAAAGIDRSRILIKIASTWEGIAAARELQAQGITCNLTLLFCPAQAAACADAKVTLISPFVGRILDWYAKSTGKTYSAADDPGVLSVQRVYRYYKAHGIKTEVMAASFRNTGQILALAGCDLLTISPELLGQLATDSTTVTPTIDASACASDEDWTLMGRDQATFRFALNEDAMASDKLAEGIRAFASDARKLDALITQTV